MAKKVAKKTPVKKSRRRLKRSIRRSLAAVLMITAIGVAAIPVPENYAADDDIMLLAEDDNDKHNEFLDENFKYEPDADAAVTKPKDEPQTEGIDLKKFIKGEITWDRDYNGDQGPLFAALFVRDVGNNTYNLSWQFAYYMVTNPRDHGPAGVVCEYNNALSANTVELPLYTNTEYFTVAQNDITYYFDKDPATKPSVAMATNESPDNAVSFSYSDWTMGGIETAPDFLKTYFRGELETWAASCAAYQSGGEVGEAPGAFSKTPSDDLDAAQQVQYFTAHVTDLTLAGGDYTLVSVQDERPNRAAGAPSTVYLARYNGGSQLPPTAVGDYYLDDLQFLVTARSDHYMCAIGDQAFKGIDNVQNLQFSENLGYIGDEAFMNASLLQSVKLGNVAFIGNRAFKNCVNLTTVDLGSGTNTIGQECFSGDRQLQSINFDVAVRTVGYGAFYDCRNMSTVSFADNGQQCTVKDYAFYNCPALTSVSMENANIVSLGEGAFASEIGSQPMGFVLPRSLSATADSNGIGDFLFAGRTALQYVVFPRDYGFTAPEIELPKSMFHACVNLQYVEFPADPVNDPYVGGFVKYNSALLFADILNADFYVKGPKLNQRGGNASPRTSTWNAETKVSKQVPYLYVENGQEYYEVSDGYYLLCINSEGMLTSCTFSPYPKSAEPWDGVLEIPAVVAGTRVIGFASGCFPDSDLNEEVTSLVISDDSMASIADGVFRGGRGDNNKDWLKLKKVYIGNSVNSIGNSAFEGCTSLVDVTFATPSGGYDAFTIGTNAFRTGSGELTFHGDIVEGYAPFDWAMRPDNIIDTERSLRVCYISPTYLTVMYNPVTEMVTLLDYPKYDEISSILNNAYRQEITNGRYGTYENMRATQEYNKYRGTEYDQRRITFAQQWQKLLNEKEDPRQLYSDAVYYGPWVNAEFCSNWQSWVNRDPNAGGGGTGDVSGNTLVSWLFEPIIAHAEEETPTTSTPVPYYTTYPFDIAQIVGANDPYRLPTTEERNLVSATRDVVIPAGVESIDVYGYRYNLRADGTPTNGDENSENYVTYLLSTWDEKSSNMYLRPSDPDEDGIRSVPGLFSGYYEDGIAAPSETRKRGNDLIQTVTMSTVKYLPDYAFDSCENLWFVQLGDELADIGKAPFRGCYSLQTVTDNDYYTTVDGIVYSYNTDGSLMIEECLSARGAGGNMPGYPYINAENDPNLLNVSMIREGAFEDCDYITGVDFDRDNTAGLTVIPEDCFKNCDSLGTVVLPVTVNEVKSGAFVGANKLGSLTVYGREVDIDDNAFSTDKLELHKQWTSVLAYADSAVVRYVNRLGDKYGLRYDSVHPLGEWWSVSFYDGNYALIEELKDMDGDPLDNPQFVKDGERPTTPQSPPNTDDWTFERWVGMNNLKLGDPIYENAAFYAQGYTTSGLVGGKYPVTFLDGVDGSQVGPIQYIDPGSDAIAPAHPVHAGYEADGFSDTYTNIQSPKTILMKYKVSATSSSGTGTGTGTGSSGTTQTPSGSTTNTSGSSSSTTSSSGSTSTTSTTSSSGAAVGKYTVTVENGSGSGTYDAGSTVIIAANAAPTGMVFQKWTTESNGVSFASVSMSATTFVMPANNVTVKANYVAGTGAAASTGSGSTRATNTSTTGTTGSGTRVDITKPGISNKDLATANVNGSTDNFVVRISETDEATRAVADALSIKYGNLENILYYAMDISLYDSTGTTKISDTTGLTVDITIPIPDALVAFGGNNRAGAVINGNQLEELNESFTTINGVPCIRFTATHFSPYTIYVDTGNLTEGMLDITPKTGDPIHPKWFLSIGLACLSIILFMKKDKKVKLKTA